MDNALGCEIVVRDTPVSYSWVAKLSRTTAVFCLLAALAPIAYSQNDTVSYSVKAGGGIGFIIGGESLCVTGTGEIDPSWTPFRLDATIGFGKMFVGGTGFLDSESPFDYYFLGRLGISTYFNKGLRLYVALTIVQPFNEMVVLNWRQYEVYFVDSFSDALCYEFGLRAQFSRIQIEPLYRVTFANSVYSGPLRSSFKEFALVISYIFEL